MADPRTNRSLNKSQEKLAEAVRENNATNAGVDDVALAPLITAEVGASTSKLLNTPRDIAGAVNKPLVQNANTATRTISTVGNIANTSPIKAPVVSSLTSPLFAYAIANEVTGAMREDGKDLNTLIGEGLGNVVANMKYGDTSQPAFSEKERQAMKDGLNVNKPIFETKKRGGKEIVGYEPLSQGAKSDLAQEDAVTDYIFDSPKNRVGKGNFIRSTFTLPDGTVVQEREDGTRFTPTPDQLDSFNRFMGRQDQPSVTGLGVGGSEGVVINKGNPNDPYGFAPQAPKVEGTGMSPLADKMLADFQRFKDSGKEMTAQQRATAEALAMSAGRVFDPETGYSRNFDPEILEEYNARVEDGRIDPSALGRQDKLSSLQLATRELQERQAQSDADFERNRAQMAEESRIRKESGGLTISVGGKQVPATPENRAKRDFETRLKEEARAEGLSEAGVRDYVRQGVEEQRVAQEEKAEADRKLEVQKVMDELNIERAEADLELKRRQLLPEAPERPSASSISSFVDTAESDFDLKFDPKTFTFETVEEGGLFSFDSQHPLNPNSELYSRLSQIEGSEYFLSPPADVMNIMEQSIEDAKQSPTGFVGVQADDGRVYNITAGGDIKHVGYSSKEIK